MRWIQEKPGANESSDTACVRPPPGVLQPPPGPLLCPHLERPILFSTYSKFLILQGPVQPCLPHNLPSGPGFLLLGHSVAFAPLWLRWKGCEEPRPQLLPPSPGGRTQAPASKDRVFDSSLHPWCPAVQAQHNVHLVECMYTQGTCTPPRHSYNFPLFRDSRVLKPAL